MTGMYQFLKKYGVAIGFGTGAVLSILTFAIILLGYPEGNPTAKELIANPDHSGIFDFGIYITYVLLGIACLVSIIFPVIYMAMNPKDSVKGFAAFAVILVLYFITQAMGDGTLSTELATSHEYLLKDSDGNVQTFVAGKTQSPALKSADGLIIFGYIMLGAAFFLMLAAALRDFFKQ